MSRRPALAAAILRVGLLGAGLTISYGAQAQAPTATRAASDAIRTLNRAELDALLAEPAEVLLVDVRRPEEISTIGGFPAFLSVQSADLQRLIAFVPRDRRIVTVSNHAHRAIQAGALLAAQGYRVAGAVGAQDYEAQGGTLVGRRAGGAVVPAAPPRVGQ